MTTQTRFATVVDLEARWHPLTDSERDKAQVLIDDASDMILDAAGDIDALRAETLTRICCQMVKRAMIADTANPTGMSQYSQTAGSFSESGTYANPTGDLYLLAAEKRALRGTQRAWHITMQGEHDAHR